MIPVDQFWFWILMIPLAGIGVGMVSAIGEVFVKIAKAKHGISDKEVQALHKEVKSLKSELGEHQKVEKMLKLQSQLSHDELKDIEEKTLPEGIAVFLFTDIEGFTRIMDEQGDEQAFELLQQHNRIMRNEVQTGDGIEIKQMGDGFMFCFPSAKKALQTAATIQVQLKQLDEQTGTPLKVRMGLHAGEPIKDEQDFIGTTVNVAERVMEQAKGGQIFVSEVIKNLASAPKEYQYVPQGERRLAGISEPQAVYEFHRIEALSSPLDSEVDERLQHLEKNLHESEPSS
jgi:class 3 adenylate cyclase